MLQLSGGAREVFAQYGTMTVRFSQRSANRCDGRTVSADDVLGLDFIGPKGSRNELLRSRVARYNPKHEWYYFPRLTPDELLVFKGFDSDSPDSSTALHTAFDDTSVSAADLVPRGSVECRFIALYD